MTAVLEIESAEQLAEIVRDETRGVMIDVWGTWCQPCRALRPHIEQLAEANADDWRIVAVHVESLPELVEHYAIQSTPTLIYLRDGEEVHRSAGAVTPSTIAADLSAHRLSLIHI